MGASCSCSDTYNGYHKGNMVRRRSTMSHVHNKSLILKDLPNKSGIYSHYFLYDKYMNLDLLKLNGIKPKMIKRAKLIGYKAILNIAINNYFEPCLLNIQKITNDTINKDVNSEANFNDTLRESDIDLQSNLDDDRMSVTPDISHDIYNEVHGIFIHINKLDEMKLKGIYHMYNLEENNVMIYSDDGNDIIKAKMFIITENKIDSLINDDKYIFKPFLKELKCLFEYKECILNNCKEFYLDNDYINYLNNNIKCIKSKMVLNINNNDNNKYNSYTWKNIKNGIKNYKGNICVLKGYIIHYNKGCFLFNENNNYFNGKDITNIIAKMWYYANDNNIISYKNEQKIYINNVLYTFKNNNIKGIQIIGILRNDQNGSINKYSW